MIAAWLFNAVHIPIDIANGARPATAFLGTLAIGFPSGLLWGYLYLRTRSIVPGALWHASHYYLGLLLFSR